MSNKTEFNGNWWAFLPATLTILFLSAILILNVIEKLAAAVLNNQWFY